ncbi:MAG: hypothetical protein P9M15_00050 [Candidatus Electryoneaceae bacterium]|nr:hypothetical protein [Candidatus Electryoneaceae bacterium]
MPNVADNDSYLDGFPDVKGDDIPADHTTQTFERIKKVLIWHSGQF